MAHTSVLLNETLQYLLPDGRVERAIDGTLGAGGHTRALIDQGVEEVLAFDLDLQAIAIAKNTLSDVQERVHIVHDSYLTMAHHANVIGWQTVDAILLDLGVSSMQFDTPERGFSFRFDAPLDMRFNPKSSDMTAADIINTWSEADLIDIFFKYGEEKYSRKLARDIIRERPFTTTHQLSDFIASAMPNRHKLSIHPATRIFQALRIAVNDELKTVETILPIAINMLKSGGRLAVISFHSLEDRIVKQVFKEASIEIIAPPGMASIEEKIPTVKLITRKPIMPSDEEIENNPRSRSSKLRVIEKI